MASALNRHPAQFRNTTPVRSYLNSLRNRDNPLLFTRARMSSMRAAAFATPLTHASFLSRRLPALRRQLPSTLRSRARQIKSQAAAPPAKVGFIGLGVMGLPMVANLGKAFPDLVVWNRSDKTAALRDSLSSTQSAVTVAATPADVVRQADITFSMLSTPEAVREVFHIGPDAAMAGVGDGKAIVDCSTLQVEDMLVTADEVQNRGGRFLEAPVSGSKGPAETGNLIFLCAGDRGVFDHGATQTAFEYMGKKAFFLGDVGNGTRMKVSFRRDTYLTGFLAKCTLVVLTEIVFVECTSYDSWSLTSSWQLCLRHWAKVLFSAKRWSSPCQTYSKYCTYSMSTGLVN